MKVRFDHQAIRMTEFGVGRDDAGTTTYALVPVDDEAQAALREMLAATLDTIVASEGPTLYEPSEKHAALEYLFIAVTDDLATPVRDLHNAANLPFDSGSLVDNSVDVFCYFARFIDRRGQRLTAVRRATQFKGILKNRLLRFDTDALRLVRDAMFKLDRDFDFVIDSSNVHIIRPSGFEFTAKLQKAVMSAVPANVERLAKDLPYVELTSIQEYASRHPRAARYLASVLAQEKGGVIDKGMLKNYCKMIGVTIRESKGKMIVGAGHELDFLEVLDRRRYLLELVKGRPERFKAASRTKVE